VVVTGIDEALHAALAGLGMAYALEDVAAGFIADGKLVRVLEDWCPPFPGYHLYFASRRQASPVFALLVDALRHRG
jgi:DNA-binding transcriptional LysR family regulator